MKTYPNQKIVEIIKEPTNKNNTYACINIRAMKKAFKELSYSARCMWIYLASNQNGYKLALSRADCIENWNIKSSTYDSVIKELIDKEYLYQEKQNSKQWFFQEYVERN